VGTLARHPLLCLCLFSAYKQGAHSEYSNRIAHAVETILHCLMLRGVVLLPSSTCRHHSVKHPVMCYVCKSSKYALTSFDAVMAHIMLRPAHKAAVHHTVLGDSAVATVASIAVDRSAKQL
jgi:hypothetical protein